jgi:hypothetical protein
LKRRRVRVRVRPAGSGSEDFVTAESQSYDSSLNNLAKGTKHFRKSYFQVEPITTQQPIAYPTTPAIEFTETETLILQTSVGKLLDKEKDIESTIEPDNLTTTPVLILDSSWTSPTTILPEVQTEEEIVTTLENKNSSIMDFVNSSNDATISSITEKDKTKEFSTTIPTIIESTDNISSTSSNGITSFTPQKSDEVKNSSGENIVQLLNSENSLRYFVTKSPAFNEYLRSQEKSRNSEFSSDSVDYPKNHRSKWSEVRQPSDKSLFNFVKWNDKNQNQSEEEQDKNGKYAGNEKSDNTTVTDYVKAVFESIKSADEEHHQSAKLDNQTRNNFNEGDKQLGIENKSVLPTEIQSSMIGSVVSQPEVSYSSKQDNLPTTTTSESATISPFVPSMMSDRTSGSLKKTPFETNLGKILKTTTTTKVSHMTEICYRGRCVMSKPKKDGFLR